MRIYFSDLAYVNETTFNHPVPLNAGFISNYAMKHLPDIDIKIFKSPTKLLDAVVENPPDVLAMTYYGWNANLDAAIARRCKNLNPNLRVVMGGPNFDHDDHEWQEWFFRTNPHFELFITGEGEPSFLRYLQILLENDLDWTKCDSAEWPSTFYSFNHESGQVIHNPFNPVGRMDLTDIPSPYLSGVLDEFLDDEHFAPIIETNRGCPYSCTFCVWGQATLSSVRQFDLQTVKDEIHYIGQRSKNPTKIFYVADANFGMFKRDVEIAEAFIECKKEYSRPDRLYIYSSKIQTKNSIETFEVLSPIAAMSMSLQSTNEQVLELVGRKNIGLENYENNRLECERRGIRTYCELIYGLPGESYESFSNGISTVAQTGQERIQLYRHLLNWGAETATRQSREKFGFKTAYRVQASAFGTYGDLSTVEYEEIVVNSNDMSFEDYLRIRELHLFVIFLGSRGFREFQHSLRRSNLDIVMLSKFILSDESNWPATISPIIREYRQVCLDELLTEDDLKKKIEPKDIEELTKKEMALVPRSICKFHARKANLRELQQYLSDAVARCFTDLNGESLEDVIQALNFSMDRAVAYDELQAAKVTEYPYDIEGWLSSPVPTDLKNFKTEHSTEYRLDLPTGLEEAFEKALMASSSLENAVYLLKFNFFPLSEDRIFSYIRSPLSAEQLRSNVSLAVASSDSAIEHFSL